MPRTSAEERIKQTFLFTKPVNPLKPTAAELNAGLDIQCRTMRNETRLSAVGSETFSEPLGCEAGNPTDFGSSNFEGSLTIFRWLDSTGKPETTEDEVWDAFKVKGTEFWAYQRQGPRHDQEWAAADADVEYFHGTTDNPQQPSDTGAGYLKKVVPLALRGDCKVDGSVTITAGP